MPDDYANAHGWFALLGHIGGLDRGFEAEGFEVIWMCERDPFCRAALAKHWPGVPVYNDAKMSIAQWRQVPRPDVIIGGFPCQDVSNAGARAGLSGDRSGLWWCIRRAVRIVGPEFLVVENVPGLFARGFDVVLRSLARVGRDAEWQVVRASDVGAPQLRARVFIVAYPQRDTGRDVEQRRERRAAGDGEELGEAGGRALADPTRRGLGEQRPPAGAGRGRHADGEGAGLVADTERWRVDPGLGRDSRSGGLADADGRRALDVADPDGRRLGKRGLKEPGGERGPRGSEPNGRGEVWELDDATLGGNVDDPAVPRPQRDLAEGGEGGIHGRPTGSTARDAAWRGWPARPGEPQHAWEPPRVLASSRGRRDVADAAGVSGARGDGQADVDATGSGGDGTRPEPRDEGRAVDAPATGAEPALGAVPDGVPGDLPGWRRAALQAIGNAVVPQVGAVLARRVRELAGRE